MTKSQLNLQGTGLSDLAFLAGLPLLSQLNLADNQIENLSPLVENDGLGLGDRIDLRGNPVANRQALAQISQLLERGVVLDVDLTNVDIGDIDIGGIFGQELQPASQDAP